MNKMLQSKHQHRQMFLVIQSSLFGSDY